MNKSQRDDRQQATSRLRQWKILYSWGCSVPGVGNWNVFITVVARVFSVSQTVCVGSGGDYPWVVMGDVPATFCGYNVFRLWWPGAVWWPWLRWSPLRLCNGLDKLMRWLGCERTWIVGRLKTETWGTWRGQPQQIIIRWGTSVQRCVKVMRVQEYKMVLSFYRIFKVLWRRFFDLQKVLRSKMF